MSVPIRLAPRIRAAEQALKHIQRSIRLRALYFKGHPSVEQAVAQGHEALTRFLQRFGALEVELKQRGVFYANVRVVMDSAQASDLGARLHSEGIEVLAFEKGTALDEVGLFVEALATCQRAELGEDEAEFAEDLLSALWRCDLRNIHYKITDSLSPASLQGTLGNEGLGAVASRIQALTRELGGGGDAEAMDAQTFLEELDALREAGELDDLVDWETKDVVAVRPTETAPARAALLARIPAHEELLERAVTCLTWTCLEEDDEDEEQDLAGATFPAERDLVRFFAGATSHLLLRGDLPGATGLVERATILDSPSRTVALPTREELGSRRGIKRFVAALGKSKSEPDELAAQSRVYLEGLGPAPVGALCDVYASVTVPSLRGLVRDYLSEHVETSAESVASLTLQRDPQSVQTGIELLVSAGKESVAFKHLLEASQDQERPLRARLASEAVDELSGERERRELLEVIAESSCEVERVRALDRLLEIPAHSAYAPLAQVACQPGFVDRPRAEQDGILDALVAVGGLRSVKVLEQLEGQRTWIFKRTQTRRLARRASALLAELKGA